jgi:hypothetical protein
MCGLSAGLRADNPIGIDADNNWFRFLRDRGINHKVQSLTQRRDERYAALPGGPEDDPEYS